MIAKRIGISGDFNGADPEHRGQHGRETKQRPRRAFEMAAQFVRPRQFFDGNAAHFGGVIFHRLPRQVARQRRERLVTSLFAQLEQIDQARTERRVARFQKARDVFNPVPPDERDIPACRCQRDTAENHRQQQTQPPAGVKVENDIEDERGEDGRAGVFHAAQQKPDAGFLLVLAVRSGQPVQDGMGFVQHNPHRRRKNQSSPNNNPAR